MKPFAKSAISFFAISFLARVVKMSDNMMLNDVHIVQFEVKIQHQHEATSIIIS